MWEADRSLPEQDMLTEAPTKELKLWENINEGFKRKQHKLYFRKMIHLVSQRTVKRWARCKIRDHLVGPRESMQNSNKK